MITPHILWSVALVVLACGLNRGRVSAAPSPNARHSRQYVALSMGLGLLLWAVVLAAEALADGLRVTPPTVRLAAGAAVGVNAVAVALSRRTAEAVTPQGDAVRLAWWALAGLARVEVGAAVWSVTLDHGRLAGGAAVLIGVATSVIVARGGELADGVSVRRLLATSALCVAIVVGVNGVLGL